MRAVGVVGVLALSCAFQVASAAPAAAAVTVTVDPSTALADGQPITVTITGLEPDFPVDTAQCTSAYAQRHEIYDCEPSNVPNVQADASGTAVVHLRARRVISTYNGIVDCSSVADPCLIAGASAADLANADTAGDEPITFDPDAPLPRPPDVRATPSDDITDGQHLTVEASGFVPGEQVVVEQCVADVRAASDCDRAPGYAPATGVADPTGVATIDLAARRVILVGSDHLDCAETIGTCVVAAHASGGPFGTVPLGFNEPGPVPRIPTLSIEPAGALPDGQIARVHGSGFSPNGSVAVVECRSDATTVHFGCPFTSVRSVTADSSGAFSTTTRVVRTLDYPDSPIDRPRVTDCGEFPGRCVLWASDPTVDTIDVFNTAITPLEFDPSARPLAVSVQVSPTDGLIDGQTVHVIASGFPLGQPLLVTECEAGSDPPVRCVQGMPVTSDDNGAVDTDFVVRRALFEGQPRFDCASATRCVIAVFFFGPRTEAATAPLTFTATPPDDSTSTTTTTTTTAPEVAPPVSGRTLARTGTDPRVGLAPASILLVVGGASVIAAAELHHRARRRRETQRTG